MQCREAIRHGLVWDPTGPGSPPHPHFSGLPHSSGRQGVGAQAGPEYHLPPPLSSSEQSEEEGEKSKRKKRKKVTEGQGEGSSSDEGSDSSSSSSESEVSSESEEEKAEPVSWRKKTVRVGPRGVGSGTGPSHLLDTRCVLYPGHSLPSPHPVFSCSLPAAKAPLQLRRSPCWISRTVSLGVEVTGQEAWGAGLRKV